MKFIPNVTAKQLIWTIAGALIVCFFFPEFLDLIVKCATKTKAIIPHW